MAVYVHCSSQCLKKLGCHSRYLRKSKMHQDDAIQEDAPPVTEDLCQWIYNLTLDDVPTHVQTRAKYLILDGLACGIVGAHAPWSETASSSLRVVEPDGNSTVFGHIYV